MCVVIIMAGPVDSISVDWILNVVEANKNPLSGIFS